MSKTSVSVGSLPAEANSKGGLNATLPPEQRNPRDPELSPGPVQDEMGGYRPASYKRTRQLPDGPVVTIIRSDR